MTAPTPATPEYLAQLLADAGQLVREVRRVMTELQNSPPPVADVAQVKQDIATFKQTVQTRFQGVNQRLTNLESAQPPV
jgi:hypothetical protein